MLCEARDSVCCVKQGQCVLCEARDSVCCVKLGTVCVV